MTPHVVDEFYRALARRDGEAMASCYHDDVVFEDPVFGVLRGGDARDMWRMLCSGGTDLTVTHRVLESTPTTATTAWVADYTFPRTGRHVRNDVTAQMSIADDRIVDHRDSFSLWGWSAQALGPLGRLLGWTPVITTRVRATSTASLTSFQARRS
ncbi:MAG: nuclear transport factor 2 family protein [Jiangellales bacterium]